MEGWSVLSSGRRHHSLLQTQPNPPLLPLSPSDSPDLSPVDPDSPSTMSNSPCHTPQLDPCLERLCECVCYREGEERRGERVWLVSWCLPPAVTQYLGNCVCLCVCVGKEGWFLGDHPTRMLCYYLSSGGYESQGMVSGKRERLPQE